MPPPATCPCGSKIYAQCCGRYHSGQHKPDTALELMKSRYSAYVLNLTDYLVATWHPSTRPDKSSLQADSNGTRWLGLSIKRHEQLAADRAIVEFVARYKPAGSGRAERLHEVSRFVRQDDQWLYVDGEFPA